MGNQSLFMGSGSHDKMAILPIYGKKDLKFYISVVHECLHLEFIFKTNARLAKLFETIYNKLTEIC